MGKYSSVSFSEMKLVGHCAVDSGQLMLIDPCYIESMWKPGDYIDDYVEDVYHASEEEIANAPTSYMEACLRTMRDTIGPLMNRAAVVTSTGWGDGYYPVFAEIKDERVMRILIDFDYIPDEEDNGDEEGEEDNGWEYDEGDN